MINNNHEGKVTTLLYCPNQHESTTHIDFENFTNNYNGQKISELEKEIDILKSELSKKELIIDRLLGIPQK